MEKLQGPDRPPARTRARLWRARRLTGRRRADAVRRAGLRGPRLSGGGAGEGARVPRAVRRGEAAAGAEVGRGPAVVAPERLGELGGLAVADPVGALADRQPAGAQHLGGP